MEDSEENLEIFDQIIITVGYEGKQKKYKIPVKYNQITEKYECKIKMVQRNLENFISEPDIIQNMQFTQCSVEIFDWIMKYMEKHKWNPPMTETPIKSARLKSNLSEIDYELLTDESVIPKYDDPNTCEEKNPLHLKNIYMAANYLDIPELTAAIVVRIATEFYLGNEQSSYEDLKRKNNIKKDLTIEEEARINLWYTFQQQQKK